ncbi:hypothetical protein OROGR_020702 [Orobanche gracilis]
MQGRRRRTRDGRGEPGYGAGPAAAKQGRRRQDRDGGVQGPTGRRVSGERREIGRRNALEA